MTFAKLCFVVAVLCFGFSAAVELWFTPEPRAWVVLLDVGGIAFNFWMVYLTREERTR